MTQPGPPATYPPRPVQGSLGQPTCGLCLDKAAVSDDRVGLVLARPLDEDQASADPRSALTSLLLLPKGSGATHAIEFMQRDSGPAD
jgi:hypothetical protein